jgi:uncharacterized integral membrane protein
MADRPPRSTQGRGLKGWLVIVGGVLLALFLVLNFQDVKVHLIIATVTMPLVIALAIAALLGALLAWALPRLRRDPRR